jgi:hypothetical protein
LSSIGVHLDPSAIVFDTSATPHRSTEVIEWTEVHLFRVVYFVSIVSRVQHALCVADIVIVIQAEVYRVSRKARVSTTWSPSTYGTFSTVRWVRFAYVIFGYFPAVHISSPIFWLFIAYVSLAPPKGGLVKHLA